MVKNPIMMINSKYMLKLLEIGLKVKIHYSNEEFKFKSNEGGGGYNNIGFIEENMQVLSGVKLVMIGLIIKIV